MEHADIAMEFGARIDICEITALKAALQALPVNTPEQTISAMNVTHMDSSSCQLLYAYMQFLKTQNSTLVINQPSEMFMQVVNELGFGLHFNYS